MVRICNGTIIAKLECFFIGFYSVIYGYTKLPSGVITPKIHELQDKNKEIQDGKTGEKTCVTTEASTEWYLMFVFILVLARRCVIHGNIEPVHLKMKTTTWVEILKKNYKHCFSYFDRTPSIAFSSLGSVKSLFQALKWWNFHIFVSLYNDDIFSPSKPRYRKGRLQPFFGH